MPKLAEFVNYCLFKCGEPIANAEGKTTAEMAVKFAFDELLATCSIPVEKTVPYSSRIDCNRIPTGAQNQYTGFRFKDVYYIKRASPPQGTSTFQNTGGDVFTLAAAVSGNLSGLSTGAIANVTPIAQQFLSMQIKNTLSTDMQFVPDKKNNCIYVTAQSPYPSYVTITYTPWFETVDEIDDPIWDNFLRRLAVGIFKENLGQVRSKYSLSNSPVQNNGKELLDQGIKEQEDIKAELKAMYNNLCSLN